MKELTMVKKIISLLLAFTLVTSNALAQDGGESSFAQDSLKDITTVAALGGFGAVLGLSTLSFVDEPSEHLRNIVVGAAIGIILGVGVVAFNQAAKSKDFYEENAFRNFDYSDRMNFHAKHQFKSPHEEVLQQVNYTFQF